MSGGNPTVEYKDGCTTQTDTINNSGLWLFTRQPKVKQSIIDNMLSILREKGYTTSQLHKVNQTNCKYLA